jgi:hypothetical protein
MYAGDVDCMASLLRRVQQDFPKVENPSVEEVSEAVARAYSTELVRVKEERHLRPNGLTWERFQGNSPPLFTDRIYEQMKSQLDETRLSTDPNQAPVLLIAGFDNNGPGHIFSVDHPGTHFSHDLVGFSAIGSGSYYALTMLHFHSMNTTSCFDPANVVLYRVAEAKFMAENDSQVGKSTTLIKWEINQKPNFVHERDIRKLWNRAGKPRMPQKVEQKIRKILEAGSYPLELPAEIPATAPGALEQGIGGGSTEVTDKMKEIMQRNSRELLGFTTNTISG